MMFRIADRNRGVLVCGCMLRGTNSAVAARCSGASGLALGGDAAHPGCCRRSRRCSGRLVHAARRGVISGLAEFARSMFLTRGSRMVGLAALLCALVAVAAPTTWQ